jgi:FdhE protein
MPRRGPIADPSKIGEASQPAFVRLPDPSTIFANRGERLRAVAEGNVLADYLRFLASLADAQNAVAASLPPVPEVDPAGLGMRLGALMPPLSPELLHGESGYADTLEWLLRRFAPDAMPSAAEKARDRLLSLTAPEITALAESIFEGAYPADRLAESLFVAAALQVHLARYASRLPARRLRPVGDGVCPTCGSAPVASLVVGWRGANRSRYCCCSLCGTMWNYLRIKCTSCGSTEGVAYSTIEQGSQDVAAETCAKCRCYIKHLQHHRNPMLEPFADDIASFGLDLLLREQGFHRGGINPLFIAE